MKSNYKWNLENGIVLNSDYHTDEGYKTKAAIIFVVSVINNKNLYHDNR